MWAETDENGMFTFVNVEPGYYANITVTSEDTSYYNCTESTIYDFIVPDTGLAGVELFQQEFVSVHEVTVDDASFFPGETKTLRFSLVNSDDEYGSVWGVELYIPNHMTVLNTTPFYRYNYEQTVFTIDDGCSNPDRLVWEGYHTVYGTGNVGNLQAVGDSVYADVEVQFASDSVPTMGIEYHVFYSYACTGGYFSYGTIMLENADLFTGTPETIDPVENIGVYPNPVTDHATFEISLTESTPVKIELYDMTGRKFQEIEDDMMQNGVNDMVMDTQNLPGGVYFYVLSTNHGTETGKFIKSN
jgi:hypothetical protein